jgi:hypothetical protein
MGFLTDENPEETAAANLHHNAREHLRVSDLLAAFDAVELWRPIPAFPAYEVSSWGQVRRGGETLAFGQAHGYATVTLSDGPVRKTARVNVLVAVLYHGAPPFPSALVAHNDGDQKNNRAANLRWASSRENQLDQVRHGTRPRGSKVHGAKLTEADIPVIRARIAAGDKLAAIARDFGVSAGLPGLIKSRKIWAHVGGAAWPTRQAA